MEKQKPKSMHTHIPELDGLRGLAILLVVCYHYFPSFHAFQFGWTGVDLFFVLSGFLITSRLYPYLDEKKILKKFYWNRFLRIVPVYYGFLSVFFLAWFFFTSKETFQAVTFYAHHWWQFFLFLQNWVFIFSYPLSAEHLNHLWSIAIEEQFYILFPLFLLLIRSRKKLLLACLALFVAGLITRSIYFYAFLEKNESLKIYWNSLFRLDPLLTGISLYFLFRKNRIPLWVQRAIHSISWVAISLLIGGAIYFNSVKLDNPFIATAGFSLIAILYGYIVYIALMKNNYLVSFFAKNSFLRYTGRISYGMYIFHWPLLLAGFTVLKKLHLDIGENTLVLLNSICCLPITYLLSHLSFTYFESFFLKQKKSYSSG
jgi:peptidoglycan/LPS O-acetylase OafA/YrhL